MGESRSVESRNRFYAHDTIAQTRLFQYGFGWRCVDAIRLVDEILPAAQTKIEYTELVSNGFDLVFLLHNLLVEHFWQSPMFIGFKKCSQDEFQKMNEQQKYRYFAAKDNGKIIAFMKISDHAETFFSGRTDMKNICGAYLLPEYRGQGIHQNLLDYVINMLNKDNIKYLGVDFESLNPTAYGFWLKHFTAYTHGLVRRIDGDIMN